MVFGIVFGVLSVRIRTPATHLMVVLLGVILGAVTGIIFPSLLYGVALGFGIFFWNRPEEDDV